MQKKKDFNSFTAIHFPSSNIDFSILEHFQQAFKTHQTYFVLSQHKHQTDQKNLICVRDDSRMYAIAATSKTLSRTWTTWQRRAAWWLWPPSSRSVSTDITYTDRSSPSSARYAKHHRQHDLLQTKTSDFLFRLGIFSWYRYFHPISCRSIKLRLGASFS